MKFGEKIRNAREDLDLSQKEVSEMIPMNQSNYSKIERDIQEPSIAQFKRICEILKLDPRYLLELGEYEESIVNDMFSDDMQLIADLKALVKKHKNSLQ